MEMYETSVYWTKTLLLEWINDLSLHFINTSIKSYRKNIYFD